MSKMFNRQANPVPGTVSGACASCWFTCTYWNRYLPTSRNRNTGRKYTRFQVPWYHKLLQQSRVRSKYLVPCTMKKFCKILLDMQRKGTRYPGTIPPMYVTPHAARSRGNCLIVPVYWNGVSRSHAVFDKPPERCL